MNEIEILDTMLKENRLDLNKVYCIDCLEFMKRIPNKYFDLIITDPPYGIEVCDNGFVGIKGVASPKEYNICEWDKTIPADEYFKEMLRISKNQIIFGGNYMTKCLPASSGWIVWDKKNDASFFADCELAWTSFPRAIRIFRYRWFGMLQEHRNWKEERYHPTQKPVELGRWILDKFANKGDIIFDPFAGSGSFLVACKQLDFNYVGCEINTKYVDIINKRLSQKNLMDTGGGTKENASNNTFEMPKV